MWVNLAHSILWGQGKMQIQVWVNIGMSLMGLTFNYYEGTSSVVAMADLHDKMSKMGYSISEYSIEIQS